jgi:hypothetical protein
MSEVKSFRTDSTKQLWRENMIYFISRYFSPNQLRNCRVLCFPGKEMREVFDVYDVLGIKRKNIVGLEERPKEHKVLEALNDSLERKIQVVNSSDLEFLQQQSVSPFDVVSLDYCGYFNNKKADAITSLVTRGWLNPRAILITNYQKGRENKPTKTSFRHAGHILNNYDQIQKATARKLAEFMMDQGDGMDQDSELGELREKVIQSFPVQKCFNGTGFWNTSFFKNWLGVQNQATRKLFEEHTSQFDTNSASRGSLGFIMRAVNESVPPQFRQFAQYFIDREVKRWLLEEHQAWQYVSDSNTAMISDFYLFKDHFMPIPKKLQKGARPVFANREFAIKVDETKKLIIGSQSYSVSAGRAEKLYNFLKAAYATYQEEQEQMLDDFPKERVQIGRTKTKLKKIKPEPKAGLEQKMEPTQEYIPLNPDKTEIYECITAKIPDVEIMKTYDLTTMQLAGYKAAHTRRLQRAEDIEIIQDFLREGHPAEEIADLFDGKYTPQKIASFSED